MQIDPALQVAIKDAGQRTAILDTNLLVVWVTSKLGLRNFAGFKRVKSFTKEDVLLLQWLIPQFRGVATTSYVLTEASNLANELSGALRDEWYAQLADFAFITHEAHVPTKVVGMKSETIRFGVADSALAHLSEEYTLITAEYRLSGYLEEMGKQVLNFNHLRPLWMLA